MPRTFQQEDTKLLGYGGASTVHDEPSYTVIDAEAQAGLEAITTRFIYLKSNCSRTTVDDALRRFNTRANLHLLQPASGKMPQKFGSHLINQLEDLVWQRLVDQYFGDYLRDSPIGIVTDEHFIRPIDSEGSDVMSTLTQYMIGSDRNDDGVLMVMSADAGVGKTTVSRTLFQELIEKASRTKTIPIYVEAQHWKDQLRATSSFYDVIQSSLALLGAKSLPEDMFFHALGKGYLSFIFDGFDELCSYQYDSFDPLDILDQLPISEGSEARILITTRSGFWKASVAGVVRTSHTSTVSLVPFNTQQSKGYFRDVFGQGTPEYGQAESLHKELQKSTHPLEHTGSIRDEIFNLPFCVRVLADYVKDGGSLMIWRNLSMGMGQGGLYRLFLAICERERTRQRLASQADEQVLSFLDVVAAYDTPQPHFDLDDLFLLEGGFREVDKGKIGEHALLQRRGPDVFCFKYEFLAPYLRALGVRSALIDETLVMQRGLVKVLERERGGEGEVSENLSKILHWNNLEAVVRRCHSAVAKKNFSLASFFFNLGLDLSRYSTAIPSDAARTEALFLGRKVVGWHFYGNIENLDLTDVTFKECYFRDVKFRRCTVSEKTTFDACVFEGSLVMSPRSKWSEVNYMESCKAVFPADASWEQVLKRAVGKRGERVDMLLNIALRKFWYRGRFKASIAKANWHRGWLGQTHEAKRVLGAMIKAGLISEVPISGMDNGGYAFDRSAVADLQSYMDGKHKSGKVRAVFRDLTG